MDEQIYREFIESVAAYFAKTWREETRAAWYQKLRNVKSISLKYIYNKITELDSLPINFPQTVFRFYHEWLLANPQHAEVRQEVGCPDCHAGWITVCYIGYGEQVYHKALKCASCNRHGHPKEAPPRYLDQVIDAGKYYRPIAFAAQDYYARLPELPGHHNPELSCPQATTVEGLVAQTADRVGIC